MCINQDIIPIPGFHHIDNMKCYDVVRLSNRTHDVHHIFDHYNTMITVRLLCPGESFKYFPL